MEHLKEVMQHIDNNSEHLPEGEYLKICRCLHKVFKSYPEQKESISSSLLYDGLAWPPPFRLYDIWNQLQQLRRDLSECRNQTEFFSIRTDSDRLKQTYIELVDSTTTDPRLRSAWISRI